MSYIKAANIAYADFAAATDLYTFDGTDYTAKTDAAPVNGTAYYQRTGAGTTADPYVYTYCVILPQQTTGWFELDTTKYVKATETVEVVGQTYFDKYTKNDGEYIKAVLLCMVQYPLKYVVGILQSGGEFVFRCEAISVIHNSKTLLGKAHAVILIQFLISVYPSAAVNTDKDRQIPRCSFRTVDIQQIPFSVRTV